MNGEQYVLRMIVDVQGDKQMDHVAKLAERITKQSGGLNKSLGMTGKGFKNMGYQVQNASYQLTDFIVMVQGGINPMRAFSQQAPQLLAGFGAAGAAVGILAALLPSVILAFQQGADVVKSFGDEVGELSGAISAANNTFDSISFMNWNREFNAASESVRGLMSSLLNLRAFQAQQEIAETGKALGKQMAESTELGFLQQLRMSFSSGGIADELRNQQRRANQGLENMQEAFGIDANTAQSLKFLNDQLEQGAIDTEKFAESFVAIAGTTENANAKFYELAVTLTELINNMTKLKDIEKQRERVESGASLFEGFEKIEKLKGGSLTKVTADLDRFIDKQKAAAESLKLAADPVYAYEQQLDRLLALLRVGAIDWDTYAYHVNKVEDAMRQATEGDGFGVEALRSFDKAFQSFVNGVAQGTADIKDAFKNMAQAIIADLLRIAAYKTVLSMLGGDSQIGAALSKATGQTAWGSAHGNVVQGGRYTGFAHGGVVTSPVTFPMRNGMGLMGEAGPEGIMPLSRMSGGDLGVKAAPVNVVVNNNAPGVDVSATPDGRGGLNIEVIRKAIAADIQAGGNAVSDAIGGTFGLTRAGV